MGRRMAGVDVEVDVVVDVVVWVDVVLVTDSLGLFRLLIVSLQNDHTNRFMIGPTVQYLDRIPGCCHNQTLNSSIL